MRRYVVLVLLLVALVPGLGLAACAPAEEAAEEPTQAAEVVATEAMPPTDAPTEEMVEQAPDSEPGLAPVDPLEVEGDIVAAGSSTVFPLSEAIADMFKKDGYTGQITIDSIGSGAGFERFCGAGETDIANASRPINDDELARCRAIGREPVELQLATDALAVVVSSENDFAQDATLEELAAIFGSAETWSDVRPDWPAEPIQRFAPGTDSGTFDYFVEEVFEKDPAPALGASNLQASEDDNVLVRGVEGSPYAVGYFGYAYFDENEGKLRALAIEGVEPSLESVESGTYPLSRPLFMYSTAEIMAQKPQVGSFLTYYLTNVGSAVERVGYFPLSSGALTASASRLIEALGR